MTTSTNFSEQYKSISNSELLLILENPDKYQPLAFEAAKQELSNRQLSDTEIKETRESLIAIQIKKEKQKEIIKAIEGKVGNIGYTLFDALNPIQSGIPTTEKVIRFLVIVFSGYFLFQLITSYDTLLIYAHDIPRFPLISSLILLPFIILPIATYTFWKRKQIGWTLLTIFLTFSAVGELWALFQSLSWKPSGVESLDNLFPYPSPSTYLIQLLFLTGTIYIICKQDMRKVFLISSNKMQGTIALTAVVSFFLIIASS